MYLCLCLAESGLAKRLREVGGLVGGRYPSMQCNCPWVSEQLEDGLGWSEAPGMGWMHKTHAFRLSILFLVLSDVESALPEGEDVSICKSDCYHEAPVCQSSVIRHVCGEGLPKGRREVLTRPGGSAASNDG
jgi:hypothetical protein